MKERECFREWKWWYSKHLVKLSSWLP